MTFIFVTIYSVLKIKLKWQYCKNMGRPKWASVAQAFQFVALCDEDRQDGFKNAVYKCSLKLPYNVHFTNKLFNDWYI